MRVLDQFGNIKNYLTINQVGGTPFFQGFRLSALQTNALPTTDQTSVSTLYMVPRFNLSGLTNTDGGIISLYTTAGIWQNFQATSVSLSLSGSSGTVQDIFAQYSGSAVTMTKLAWLSTTARVTSLALQDGQLVLSTDATQRYLGTIYLNGTNSTEDSQANRYIWNMENQYRRSLKVQAATSSYNSTNTSWEPYTNVTYKFSFVRGLEVEPVHVTALGQCQSVTASGTNGYVGIGIDSSSVNSAQILTGGGQGNSPVPLLGITANYEGFPGIGQHYAQMLETCQSAISTGFYGNAANILAGMWGWVLG